MTKKEAEVHLKNKIDPFSSAHQYAILDTEPNINVKKSIPRKKP
jgi:hypothetical protein